MGVAEVIPGVSGGTIAFITGIYDRLLGAIAAWSPASAQLLWRKGLVAFWQRHDMWFLLTLAAGMALSYLATARVIGHLIDTRGPVLWGFFLGLVAAAVVQLLRETPWRFAATFGVAGAAAGAAVATLAAAAATPGHLQFFLGGAVAVTAWILPGISGSLVLLLLGLYEPFVAAVNALRLDILAAAGAGMVLGLLTFAKVISFVLRRHRAAAVAALTGLMAGSMLRLWPWRADGAMVTPQAYAAGGEAPFVWAVAVAVVGGIVCTALLARGANAAGR